MDDRGSRPFSSGEWRIDPSRGRLSTAEREHKLEPNVMAVLVALARHRGAMVSRRDLLQQVWEGRAVSDDVLTVAIYRLRKLLGDSAQDPRFIATVPGEGYRWVAPIEEGQEPASEELAPARLPQLASNGAGRREESRRARLGVWTGARLLLLLTAASLAWHSTSRESSPDPSQVGPVDRGSPSPSTVEASLAVLPFVDLGPDGELSFLAEGLGTELVDLLVRSAKIRVSGRASATAAQRAGWTIPQIGRELDVRHVLEGSVQKDAGKLRVTVQLSDSATGFYLWSESYERELGDVFELQSEIAATIAQTLDLRQSVDPESAEARQVPANLEAYEAYLRGRYHLQRGGRQPLLQAVAHFRRAIAIDAGYAAAYAGLADAYVLLPVYARGSRREFLEKARDAAEVAMALADQLAEVQTSRAEVKLWLEGDIDAAERGLRRALELDPTYATAHHRLGDLLYWRRGRVPEALAHHAMAERSDPLNPVFKKAHGQILLASGSIDAARAKFRAAAEEDPSAPDSIWGLAQCAFAQRRYAEAIELLERLLRLEEDGRLGHLRLNQLETLTMARHLLGDHEQELRDAKSAKALAPGDPWPLQMEARARAALGQSTEVRRLVEHLLEMPGLTGFQANWWLRLVAELHWHGDPETAGWVAAKLAGWYRDRTPTSERAANRLAQYRGLALALAGQRDEASSSLRSAHHGLLDCNPFGSNPNFLGEVGSLAALAGDRTAAVQLSARLNGVERRAEALFWQAAIAASLGERSRAVELLRQSVDHGFADHAAVHSGTFFVGLYDYRPFRQLAEREWGWPPPNASRS